MKAYEKQVREYIALNQLATPGGTVVFGGAEDRRIPVGELKQSFAIHMDLYNRSVDGLRLADAPAVFEACVSPLQPECVILRLGASDVEWFPESPAGFDRMYRNLIACVRRLHPNCRVALLTLDNPEDRDAIRDMNRRLRYLADAERCEFFDVAEFRLWNPQAAREVASFVYSTGFLRPLKAKKPLYDLVRILYAYGNQAAPSPAVRVEQPAARARRLGRPEVSFG